MPSPSESDVASRDPLKLAGKVCLVTGGSRGIGRDSARLLALSGANVILVGRDEQALFQAAQEINREAGAELARPRVCDVTDEAAVRDLYQAVFKSFKRLDVLVANAGVLDDALIGMVSRPQIERVFSVNTFGVLYCAQYASRLMARSGGGSIVNITSIIGTHGNPGQAVYGGSKAAVIGITKSLAKELAPQNVRVNAVAPGFIDTDMTRGLPRDKYEARARSIGMGRVGTPQDVAKVVLFLASDLSSYVTGQIIGVDGAMVI
ncbi:MAG TPA: SDR family NAD(P)-dependent oxidoreductase [Burkholderiaceae bacterium]|nr:SDR family NAD(P)-dependent oxidoreductase [Burkholderiaceae bacterium]